MMRLQQRVIVADVAAMRALLLGFASCLAIASGVVLASNVSLPAASELGLAAAMICCLLACGCLRLHPRLGFGVLLAVVVLAGFTRGVTGMATPTAPTFEGPPTALIGVAVIRASVPGSRCRVAGSPLVAGVQATELWQVSLPPRACPLAAGDQVWVPASDVGSASDPLPGSPSGPQRAQRQGYNHKVWASRFWLKKHSKGGNLANYWRWVASTRQAAWNRARGDPGRGFVMASALGQASSLPPSQRDDLRAAGLGHVIAVSGMHVGVAALVVYSLCLRVGMLIGRSLVFGVLLSWLPVAGYVGLTGGAPSAVRAAVMFTLLHFGTLCGRRAHGLSTLAIAGALLLAAEPSWALSPGFHLSFAAMAAIVRPGAPSGMIAQSWHVTWATVPVALWHFGSSSLYGALSNLAAIPVFTIWVVPTAIFGLFTTSWWGEWALEPAARGSELILDIAAIMAQLPRVPEVGIVGFALVALVLRAVARRRKRKPNPWLPGPLTCAAIACIEVISLSRTTPAPALGQAGGEAWILVGNPRRWSTISPSTSDPRTVCLDNPHLAPSRWPGLLRALGYNRVALSPGEQSSRTTSPHLLPIREHLAQAGLLVADTTCLGVDPQLARDQLEACIHMHHAAGFTTRTALVRGGPADVRACFLAGNWQNLEKFGTSDGL